MFPVVFILLVVGVIVTVIVAGHKHNAQLQKTWAAAGRELRLEHRLDGILRPGTIRGRFGHCTVRVTPGGNSKNKRTRYRIDYGPLDFPVRIKRQSLLSQIGRTLGLKALQTGDDAFDDYVHVESSKPQAVLAHLNEARRKTLRKHLHGYGSCKISERTIEFSSKGYEKKASAITRTVRDHCLLAERLLLPESEWRVAEEEVRETQLSPYGRATLPPHVAAAVQSASAEPGEEGAQALALAGAALASAESTQPWDEAEESGPLATEAIDEEELTEASDESEPMAQDSELEAEEEPAPAGRESGESEPLLNLPETDPLEIGQALFGPKRLGAEVLRQFAAEFEGHAVRWRGVLRRSESYQRDTAFGTEPGTRAFLRLGHATDELGLQHEVRACLHLPAETQAELAQKRGEEFLFQGELVRCDPYQRILFVDRVTLL